MQPMMKQRAMDEGDTLRFLSKGRDGVLSCNGADGYPYGVPVNYVFENGKIYFHGRAAGEKFDDIARDGKVCFTVYSHESFEITGPETCNVTTDYACAIVRGRCRLVEDQSEKESILFRLVERLVPEKATAPVNPERAKATAVFCIDIETMTGKKHPAKPGNRTV